MFGRFVRDRGGIIRLQTSVTREKYSFLFVLVYGASTELVPLGRFIGEEHEDPRYQAFRRHLSRPVLVVSYFQVFMLRERLPLLSPLHCKWRGLPGSDPLMLNDWIGSFSPSVFISRWW